MGICFINREEVTYMISFAYHKENVGSVIIILFYTWEISAWRIFIAGRHWKLTKACLPPNSRGCRILEAGEQWFISRWTQSMPIPLWYLGQVYVPGVAGGLTEFGHKCNLKSPRNQTTLCWFWKKGESSLHIWLAQVFCCCFLLPS